MKIEGFEEIFQLDARPVDETIEECKGLVFRGQSSQYWQYSEGKLGWRQSISLLKRKSCPGCRHCVWMLDDLADMIDSGGVIWPKYGIENGKLYSLAITNESRDWESGVVDGYDFEIVEIIASQWTQEKK